MNSVKRKIIKAMIVGLMLLPQVIFSQTKQTQSVQQVWTGFFNQTRISNKLGFWFDGQVRTREEYFDHLSTLIIRPGITYYLSDAARLTAGYGYIRHFAQGAHSRVDRPEHRPWQQIQWHTRYNKLRTMQYLRLEERFLRKVLNDSTLGEGNNFNFRVRYNFFLQLPLTATRPNGVGLSLVANDEMHVNFGREIVYNYFDQNRFFLGLGINVNQHDNIQLGYLNVFQQLAAGNRYRSIHAARIAYNHNLDLRKKPKQN